MSEKKKERGGDDLKGGKNGWVKNWQPGDQKTPETMESKELAVVTTIPWRLRGQGGELRQRDTRAGLT